jgi:nicotinamidase-related amidase
MIPIRELPLPGFFEARHAAEWGYRPDQAALFAAAAPWRREHGISPSAADRANLHLLLIDVQRDFCFPEGALYVAGRSGRGAIDDNRRLAAFLYRNLAAITNVTTTMDTHFAYQIFFPSFWVGADDEPLTAHREVTADDVRAGRARPNPALAAWLGDGSYAWLLAEVQHYCAELERAGKYRLYLWPPHCILGSDGHTLAGVIHEARTFHAFVRGAQSWIEVKGTHPLTESYSVLRPEVLVRHDGQLQGQQNTHFLKTLVDSDAVIIAGQAASHCVKSTIDDLLDVILRQDPELVKKVYLLTDCMSAVTVPDGAGGFVADFTPQAEAALGRFADAGMHLVESVQPLAGWPGLAARLSAGGAG